MIQTLPIGPSPTVLTGNHVRRDLIALQRGEHCHGYAQVLLGWRGHVDCEFSESLGRLSNGIAALVPASAQHLYAGLGEQSELLVIDVSLSDPYILALQVACGLNFSSTLFQRPEFISLDDATLPLLDFAAGQLQLRGTATDSAISCQLISLFMTQLCQLYSLEAPRPLQRSRLAAAELNRIIERRLAEPPSNAQLACALNLSESHFMCLFVRHFGVTPQKYVMSRRLQQAKSLLLKSNMSLTELAGAVGFADASSFSRAFKRHFNETPGSLRTRHSQRCG